MYMLEAELENLGNMTAMGFVKIGMMVAALSCNISGVTLTELEEHSPDNYITYHRGDFPLIISVPHGGYSRPDSIPNRHDGCYINGKCVYTHYCGEYTSKCRAVTSRDSNTREIAIAVSMYIQDTIVRRPHMIINELHRSKLDTNRDVHLATFDDPESLNAYGNYTLFIHKARTLIGLKGDGRGLFVEIHGQTHSEQWTELGYRLDKDQLNAGDASPESCSIRALQERTCGNDAACASALVSGELSFGKILSSEGYRVVPSPEIPSPGNGGYYRGGYNTETYGSRQCGNIDAIQVEIPRDIRFGDWEVFAGKLGASIISFMDMHEYDCQP